MVRSSLFADGHRYHVHQELKLRTPALEDTSSFTEEGYICKKCQNDLRLAIVPLYSVAKIVFGLIFRLDLPDIYPIEKLLIARHCPLAITLKLSRGGSGPDGMLGHVCWFFIVVLGGVFVL